MKIIGICGKARSGKDSLANFLVENHGFLKLSFAAPIRRFVADIVGTDVSEMEDGPLKEQPVGWLDGVTPRRMMQTVGTEWGREMIDRDLWVKVVENKIRQARREGAAGVVISDVRFNNEAENIRDWGGVVIEVRRTGRRAVQAHKSEEGVSDELVSITFDNDGPMHQLATFAWVLSAGE